MFAAFLHDETGATAIEYALIACLVSIVIAASVFLVGQDLNNGLYTPVATSVDTAIPD